MAWQTFLTARMNEYIAAAIAVGRWGSDQTEAEVLQRNLRDARRHLIELMDEIERSAKNAPDPVASESPPRGQA